MHASPPRPAQGFWCGRRRLAAATGGRARMVGTLRGAVEPGIAAQAASLLGKAAGVIGIAFTLAAAPAQALTLLTEENPPFNYTDGGRIVGSATEIVAAIMKEAGLPVREELLPWDTAFRRAQAEKDTCVFATARLENRERLFLWVGPLANSYWGVFARGSFGQPIRSLADMKPYRIGGVVNDAKIEYLQENNITNTRALAEDRFNPPRLMLPPEDPNHIDLWITNLYAAPTVAKAARVTDVKLVFVAREVPVYLACSPQTSPTIMKALTDAFDQVNARGLPARVVAEYDRKFGR